MNLVFVNSAWPESWGGGEKWTIEAADYFHTQGHTVLVVGRAESRILQSAHERGIMVESLRFGADIDLFSILRARRLLLTHRPDLVVVNFNKEAWQFGIAGRSISIPVVARHGFPLLRNVFHHRFLAKRILSRIVVNAESIREEYSHLGYDAGKFAVIHNGVRESAQRAGELRARCGVKASQLLITAAGRLESQKRFDLFIEIAACLSGEFRNARFVIIGEGPLRDSLKESIARRGLQEVIAVKEFMPDFASVIGDADLFLMTSEKEGTPNVLLEAASAGVPCGSFAVGSVPQILQQSLRDYCIPFGDLDTMTHVARTLLADKTMRAAIGKELQLRVRNQFSFERSMKQFEDIFRGMTGEQI